jgi:peptide/nickel transport system permease protein
MWAYIVRRFVQGIFILFIVTGVCFMLTRLSSDPMAQYAGVQRLTAEDRARIRESLGLDQPLYVQYVRWLGLALEGDLGLSLFSKQPVLKLIQERLPMTIILMVTAQVVIVVLSVALGTLSAVKQYSWFDNLVSSFSFIGYSMPIFFIALMLMLVFAVQFKAWGLPYFPTGADIWDFKDLSAMAWHLVLPVSALVIIQTAAYSRYVRSSMLEVLGQDYVRAARAKGLTSNQVVMKHALRNAALPFVTVLGLDIPFLLGGAIVTESIFAWPGMGRLFWEYAGRGDYPVVMGVLLLVSTAVIFFTIVTDVAYTFIDPRIRLS